MIGTLTVPGPSPLHRLAPHTKVAALVLFVLAVVATPREALWAHAVHACMVVGLARAGGLGLRTAGRRLLVEAPFLAFALLLPFAAGGERVQLLGTVAVSRDGLWGAWAILAKGTLGVAAALVVVATTPVAALLQGLRRLHVPAALTMIATTMVRYLDVVAGELRRLQVARVSRGDDPRWLGQARALSSTLGALFVRTFERGERVHLAMVARGFDGSVPLSRAGAAPVREWALALSVPALAAVVAAGAWLAR